MAQSALQTPGEHKDEKDSTKTDRKEAASVVSAPTDLSRFKSQNK